MEKCLNEQQYSVLATVMGDYGNLKIGSANREMVRLGRSWKEQRTMAGVHLLITEPIASMENTMHNTAQQIWQSAVHSVPLSMKKFH